MISHDEVEQLAAVWARRDSLSTGAEHRATVEPFDLGYVVRVNPVRPGRRVPGDRPATVVDGTTGEITSWPPVTTSMIIQQYRRFRDALPVTIPRAVDPAVELRRLITRRPTPAVVASLTVGGERFTARGAKGDQEFNHHPLVRHFLGLVPPGARCRGAERHAELIATSDALYREDWRRAAVGKPPLTLEDARAHFRDRSHLEVIAVREPGDPMGGRHTSPCPTCIETLVYLRGLPEYHIVALDEYIVPPQLNFPRYGGLSREVSDALSGVWEPEGWDGPREPPIDWGGRGLALPPGIVADWAKEVRRARGSEYRHPNLPTVVEVLQRGCPFMFRAGVGEQQRIRQFVISPLHAKHTADSLGDFARVLGARLFPIGGESVRERLYQNEMPADIISILAADEHGRIFLLDQAGEWFVGESMEAALATLVLGGPTPRVRDDGTW